MKTVNIYSDIVYGETKPNVSLLLQTLFTKEIRIAMKKGQIMKEHQAPYPIVIEMVEGKVNFGVNGEMHIILKGDILSLEGAIPHDLTALEDSIVRLTLSTLDSEKRVEKVAKEA